MHALISQEKESLLAAGKKIVYLKTMQTRAYEASARKAKDEATRRLLKEVAETEAKDTQHWIEEIRSLGESPRGTSRFLDLRVGAMMRILGIRGFLEWAVIAEDEVVEELAIRAASLDDPSASEKWTMVASDESLHIYKTKQEILGMESWEMSGGQGVAEVVFGASRSRRTCR